MQGVLPDGEEDCDPSQSHRRWEPYGGLPPGAGGEEGHLEDDRGWKVDFWSLCHGGFARAGDGCS